MRSINRFLDRLDERKNHPLYFFYPLVASIIIIALWFAVWYAIGWLMRG